MNRSIDREARVRAVPATRAQFAALADAYAALPRTAEEDALWREVRGVALSAVDEAVARRMAELEAFAGQISHDLQSPHQTVQRAVGAIEEKAEDPRRSKRSEIVASWSCW